mgnify:CR=1 FL=1
MKIKSIVLGDRAVGKTTFVQHLNGRFYSARYTPTIGVDFTEYSKSGTILQIWDTSGSTKYREVTRTFMRNTDLCIVMYRDKRSLGSIQSYIDSIRILSTEARIVIVSNANDLDVEVEGQMIASRNSFAYFFACNSLDRVQALQTWHEIIELCNLEIEGNGWLEHKKNEDDKIVNITRQRYCWWF